MMHPYLLIYIYIYIIFIEWKSHQSIKCEPEPEVIKYEDAKESFHPKGQFDKRNPPEEITKQAFDPVYDIYIYIYI